MLAFEVDLEGVVRDCLEPPDDSRPWVYWYFMDGHARRVGMAAVAPIRIQTREGGMHISNWLCDSGVIRLIRGTQLEGVACRPGLPLQVALVVLFATPALGDATSYPDGR